MMVRRGKQTTSRVSSSRTSEISDQGETMRCSPKREHIVAKERFSVDQFCAGYSRDRSRFRFGARSYFYHCRHRLSRWRGGRVRQVDRKTISGRTPMCPPGCLHSICENATRRGFLKAGFGVGLGAAATPFLAVSPARAAQSITFAEAVDLTHPLYEGFPTFDGSKWFTKEPFLTYAKDKLNINRWMLVEHTGTHMDAPLHFSADGASVDMLPISDLVVPLAVIDISERARSNPDSAVTPDDVKAWEASNGPLPEGCCVAMNSGWGKLLELAEVRRTRQRGQEPYAGLSRRNRAYADDRAKRERAGRRYAFAGSRHEHGAVPGSLFLAPERPLGRGVPGEPRRNSGEGGSSRLRRAQGQRSDRRSKSRDRARLRDDPAARRMSRASRAPLLQPRLL